MDSNKYTPLIVFFLVALGMFLERYITIKTTNDNFMFVNNNNKILEVVNAIENKYVEKISTDSLAEEIIPKLLEKLDPHSTYIPAKDIEQAEERLNGKINGGIGIEYNFYHDTLIVMYVLKNSPAAESGIIAGDRIIKIDTNTIYPATKMTKKIPTLIRGDINTYVNLSIKRSGCDSLMIKKIKRNKIPLPSVETAFNINDSIRYIKITSFGSNTYKEFCEQTVDSINKFSTLIIDLRDNGGGYLQAVIKIANEILPHKAMIVYTQNREGRKREFYADSKNRLKDKKIIILVDSWSASASEILAGAIQDNDRGIIVGRRTFGKGLVQTTIDLNDGSQLRLTTERYYTPTGRCIQKPYGTGVNYNDDIKNRLLNGELDSAIKNTFPDSLKFTTPKGKTVYGGGGIMPDIFVPESENKLSEYILKCNRQNLFKKFSALHFNAETAKYNNNAVTSIFDDNLLYNKFINFTIANGVKPQKEEDIDNQYINNQIKAAIKLIINDETNCYKLIQNYDNDLKTALSTLEQ